jgi:hypothetical protein
MFKCGHFLRDFAGNLFTLDRLATHCGSTFAEAGSKFTFEWSRFPFVFTVCSSGRGIMLLILYVKPVRLFAFVVSPSLHSWEINGGLPFFVGIGDCTADMFSAASHQALPNQLYFDWYFGILLSV